MIKTSAIGALFVNSDLCTWVRLFRLESWCTFCKQRFVHTALVIKPENPVYFLQNNDLYTQFWPLNPKIRCASCKTAICAHSFDYFTWKVGVLFAKQRFVRTVLAIKPENPVYFLQNNDLYTQFWPLSLKIRCAFCKTAICAPKFTSRPAREQKLNA